MSQRIKRIGTLAGIALTVAAFALSLFALFAWGFTLRTGASVALPDVGGDSITVDIDGDGTAEFPPVPNISTETEDGTRVPSTATPDSGTSSLSGEVSDAVEDVKTNGGLIGAIIAIVVVIAIIIAVVALMPKKKM